MLNICWPHICSTKCKMAHIRMQASAQRIGDANDGLSGPLALPLPSGSMSLGGLGDLGKPGL